MRTWTGTPERPLLAGRNLGVARRGATPEEISRAIANTPNGLQGDGSEGVNDRGGRLIVFVAQEEAGSVEAWALSGPRGRVIPVSDVAEEEEGRSRSPHR